MPLRFRRFGMAYMYFLNDDTVTFFVDAVPDARGASDLILPQSASA